MRVHCRSFLNTAFELLKQGRSTQALEHFRQFDDCPDADPSCPHRPICQEVVAHYQDDFILRN